MSRNPYQERDVIQLADYFTRHMYWMTKYNLREKADIAAELAYRDWKIDRMYKELYEVEQILGKVLKYPWYKDDQKNFPGATEKDGVCIGEHTAGTIAQEAASKVTAIQDKLQEIKRLVEDL